MFTEFEVLAIYSNDYPCSCQCCVFRQYIDTKITGKGLGPDAKPLPFQPKAGEDVAKDGSRFGHPGESPSCIDWTRHASCESYRIEGLSPKARTALDAALEKVNFSSFCIYYMRDYPGIFLGRGDAKKRSDCFLGVVKSKCPPCPTVVSDSFSLQVAGSVDIEGHLTQQKPEKGEKGYNADASCEIPSASGDDCG